VAVAKLAVSGTTKCAHVSWVAAVRPLMALADVCVPLVVGVLTKA